MSELLQIFVFRDGAYVGNEVYTDSEVLIGRSDGVDLVLDDDLVSPRHAIIKQEPNGQIRLTRLGNMPLRVNRKDIASTFINSRDEIQIGEHTLKIKILEQQKSNAPRSTRSIPEVHMTAALADDLSNEAMTEVVTASIDISDSNVLAARAISNSAKPAHVQKPSSIPVRGTSQIDGVWDEGSLGEDASALNNALDSTFNFDSDDGANRPRDTSPRAVRPDLTAKVPVKPSLMPDMLRPDPREAHAHAHAPAQAPRRDNGARISPEFQGDVDRTLPRAERPAPSFSQPVISQPISHPVAQAPVAGTPVPMAFVADDDDDMDEEEIDAWTRPGFSLLRTVVQQSAAPSAHAAHKPAVEVLAFTGDAVRQAAILIDSGERYVLGRTVRGVVAPPAGYPGLRLAKLAANNTAEIEFPSSAEGVVIEGTGRKQLEELMRRENAVSKTGDVFRYTLREGGSATLKIGDTTFHVRFVRPPKIVEGVRPPFDWAVPRAVGAAIVTHMLVLVLVAVLRPSVVYSDAPHEVWSDPQKNEVREVEIKPPPEPEPVAEVKQPEPEPEPEPEPKPEPRKKKVVKEEGGGKEAKEPKGVTKQEMKSAGVLGAMGKLNLAAPGKKSIVQAVSNIDAVRAPGGSNFRVGALVGKLPASEVSVGGGGGGGLLTRGGASLLRGGEGLAQLGKRGGGKVRGSVTKVTARMVEAKGSISREEVAAVINQHLREVQYCYEKTLLKDPGLSGKLVLEWVIDTDGAVGRVKEKLSTLRNPEVSSCISTSLKRWTFPKPRGGIVIVSYPFIFNAVGF